MTNAGAIDLQDGKIGDRFTVDGTFTAAPGSLLLVDVDLGDDNAGGTQLGDQLVVTGAGSGGVTTIDFANISDSGRLALQTNPIVIGSFGSNTGAAPVATGLPTG